MRLLFLAALLASPNVLYAPPAPAWWADRGVINPAKAPDPWAAANLGQLKRMAVSAKAEFDAKLPGRSGRKIDDMVADFGHNLTRRSGVTATQSSTGWGGLATFVIDGNTSGTFASGSVAHTLADANPWWQVNLNATRDINAVEVWNRTDCCGERTANFYVFISASDMSQRSLADLLGDASIWKSSKITSAPNPSATIATSGANGKFVMIRIEGAQYLNLAEVKVHGKHDDYAAATIGQLKTVSAPFWDRLS